MKKSSKVLSIMIAAVMLLSVVYFPQNSYAETNSIKDKELLYGMLMYAPTFDEENPISDKQLYDFMFDCLFEKFIHEDSLPNPLKNSQIIESEKTMSYGTYPTFGCSMVVFQNLANILGYEKNIDDDFIIKTSEWDDDHYFIEDGNIMILLEGLGGYCLDYTLDIARESKKDNILTIEYAVTDNLIWDDYYGEWTSETSYRRARIEVKDNDFKFISIVETGNGSDYDKEFEYEYLDVNDIPLGISEGNISIFHNVSGNAGNTQLSKYFPSHYNVIFPSVDTTIWKESDGQGGYKIRVAYGLNSDWIIGYETFWNNFKKNINDAKEKTEKTGAILKRALRYGEFEKVSFIKGFSSDADMSFLGYYEATFDQYGTIKPETEASGMLVGAEWSAKHSTIGVIPYIYVPYYIDITGGMEAEAIGKIYLEPIDFAGEFIMSPNLGAGAGIGLSGILGTGVEGTATANVVIVPWSKGYLEGKIAIVGYAFFMAEGKTEIASITTDSVEMWDYTSSVNSLQPNTVNYDVPEELEMDLLDRDFQKKTTAWNGNVNNKKRTRSSYESSEHTLQEYILPSSMPIIKRVGSDTVMVFQSNDADRDTQNCVKLMYSVYDGTSWSEPEAFYDNGTLDTFADVKVIDDELYVVWQKCNKVINDDDAEQALNTAAQASDIYLSKYDKTSHCFGTAEALTSDDTYDYIPKLVNCYNEPGVIWVSSRWIRCLWCTGNQNN